MARGRWLYDYFAYNDSPVYEKTFEAYSGHVNFYFNRRYGGNWLY